MHEIFPVGVLPILHVPGAASFHDATLVYQLLRPLVRRRALEAFGTILECRGAGEPLGPALEQLLPAATVSALPAEALGTASPDSADLVVAHAVLSTLDRDRQLAFLEAVHPALREGGFVAATVRGDLLQTVEAPEAGGASTHTKEYAIDAYSGLFEVADYVRGGAANLYDLVILRKR
jgi:hypothetical protein